ncbi:MinD/ParA family ATP-binding protein [Halobaculum marinum]|uniref:MinD/ParA family protein n=1 Tax=Halobaculum marinum TaxID=3031996 RepID=A0ABD5WSA1_9EURY|nr:AAA family ATPase [Halobaculum sp. DT55]
MIAITGGKGGTGKTTTTLALGRALVARGRSVLVVDGDWDLPDLGALAGRSRRVDYPEEPRRAPERGVAVDGDWDEDGDASLHVLPAPERPTDLEPHDTFRVVADGADPETTVLVDCPAGAAPDAVAPVRAADRALLVTEACAAALRDAAKTAAVARRVDTSVAGAVVTRAAVVPSGVDAVLGCPVLGCVPGVDGAVEASARGRAAYRAIAAQVADDEPSVKSRRTV